MEAEQSNKNTYEGIKQELRPKPTMEVLERLKEINEAKYPRGKREEVINKMTKVSKEEMKEWNSCRSWKEIYEFHKKNTPWLDDTQINEAIKYYKALSQTLEDKGELREYEKWKLNDL